MKTKIKVFDSMIKSKVDGKHVTKNSLWILLQVTLV